MVHCIIQDSKGFIWIGTKDGLNRYDGYDFRVFLHDPFDSLSISDNRIQNILEDHHGRFWIATPTGLNLFDPRREVFHNVRLDQNQDPLRPFAITGMMEDSHHDIWILTPQFMLYRLTLPDSAFDVSRIEVLSIDLAASAMTSENARVEGMLIQVSDSIFIVRTPKGLNTMKVLPHSELISLSSDLSWFADQEVLNTPGLKRIMKSKKNHFWICDDHSMSRVLPMNSAKVTFDLSGLPEWEAYHIWALDEDSQGNAVVATTKGLVFCNTTSPSEFHAYGEFGFPQNHVGTLLFDLSDNLWIGTTGNGLFKPDLRKHRFGRSKAPDDEILAWTGASIRAFLQLRSGEILIAPVSERAFVLSPGNDIFRINGFHTTTLTFYETRDGKIWAADENLHQISKDPVHGWMTERSVPIPKNRHPNGIKILESRDSTFWVLTMENLCKFDRDRHTFACIDLPLRGASLLSLPEFPTMAEDVNGNLWLGTDAGLMQYDPKRESFRVFTNDPTDPKSLASNIIRCITPDPLQPEHYLWLGLAGGGLDKFEINTGACRHFGEAEGLPDMVVYGILPDSSHHLWMSTNHGLVVMDLQTESFKSFDMGDGLVNDEFNSNAYAMNRNGVMLFGGVSGFNRFKPELVNLINHHSPPIAFTEFKVSNKTVSTRDRDFPYPESITYAESLTIPPSCKTFSIEFTAFDFTAPEKNQFRYLLDGFDSDWQFAGGARSATYTNLDPGKYTFRVMASNNDGIWNAQGIEIGLTLIPPWYKTWWAYLLYVSAIAAVLYFLRRKELQEQRLKHQLVLEHVESEKLKEVDRLKSRFFTNISHELRTPLTLILGNLERANDHTTDETARKGIRDAARNSNKLLQLISQLLDLSKIDAGHMQLHRTELDLVPFLRHLLTAFESLAEQHSINLKFSTTHDRVSLGFDSDKMEWVMINLLSNAFKFTPDGGEIEVAVECSTRQTGSEKEICVIKVQDTGPGIPEVSLSHIFDRFYQSDTGASSVRQGTGIGLALVKEFVQLHGGEVTAANREVHGAVFTIELPVVHVPTVADGKPDYSQEDGPRTLDMAIAAIADERVTTSTPAILDGSENVSDEKFQILIVEDNIEVRTFLRAQLEADHYTVAEAGDGHAGLQSAIEIIPDLILTDVMMPVMDGLALSREVRADIRTSHIPIIMLTARADEEARIEGLETGVDDYLTKPVSSRELKLRIANLIEQRRRLRERFSLNNTLISSEVIAKPLDQSFLEMIFQTIEAQLHEADFGVEPLADQMHMSVKNLTRKLNALTGHPPGQLIRNARLQRAAELLSQHTASVAEVAYDVGFTVPENFSRSFKKHFGVSPSEYARTDRA